MNIGELAEWYMDPGYLATFVNKPLTMSSGPLNLDW